MQKAPSIVSESHSSRIVCEYEVSSVSYKLVNLGRKPLTNSPNKGMGEGVGRRQIGAPPALNMTRDMGADRKGFPYMLSSNIFIHVVIEFSTGCLLR